jgi:hypothetical protein
MGKEPKINSPNSKKKNKNKRINLNGHLLFEDGTI